MFSNLQILNICIQLVTGQACQGEMAPARLWEMDHWQQIGGGGQVVSRWKP